MPDNPKMFKFEIIEPKTVRVAPELTVDAMQLAYESGRTLEEVGRFFGITRERVRQLINTAFGGGRIRNSNRRELRNAILLQRRQKREAKIAELFGCSFDEIAQINGAQWNWSQQGKKGCRTPANRRANAYMDQRRNAIARGIEWKISFTEWWEIWENSGRWSQRGRGKTLYCMSRKADQGPYSKANVEIVSNVRNSSDGIRTRFRRDSLGLTPRERQVYDFMKLGQTSAAEIAMATGLAQSVVRQYKVNLTKRGFFLNPI